MKILYITQYFLPEICAPSNRAYANVKYFSEKGHKVVVLTEMPNHPKGVIFKGYKRKIFLKEKMENFSVDRVWVFTSVKKNFFTRILFYLSFMFMGFLHTLFNWRKYDIIYVSSPPLFVGVIGIFLKKLFPKTKFVFEVRDLWPKSAVDLVELRNPKMIRLAEKLERKIYNICEKIIVISKYQKNDIIKKGFQPSKIKIIYNGTDIKLLENKIEEPKDLKLKYAKKGTFVALYAGNFGLAQNLETLLTAVQKLEFENVKLLLIGSGPKEKELKQRANSMNLKSIEFVHEIPREKIDEYLFIADCGVIPLRKLSLFWGALPSKLFDYMACGLPILLGIEGEAKDVIEKSKAGICFEPEDSADLAEKIIWMKNHPKERIEMGKRGRKFVEKYYNREKQAKELEKELLKLVEA
ncbi:MAG: glycosyltransferase family 4 protein [Candidatus Cloacimonetes bacterium]|nr:glycosyltransferase family 4 protein [Candidatus Cloacimonadota bacterium]